MFSSWFGTSTSTPAADAPQARQPAASSSSSAARAGATRARPTITPSTETAASRQHRLLETVFQSSIESLLLEATKHRSLAPLREVALLTRQHHYPPHELFQTLVLACDLCLRGKTTRTVLLQCLSDIGKLASLGLMAVTTPVALSVCDLVRRLAFRMHAGSTHSSGDALGTSEATTDGSPDGGAGTQHSEGTAAATVPTGLTSILVTTELLVEDEELLVRLAQLVMAYLSACPLTSDSQRHLLGMLFLLYAGSTTQSMLEATCDVAITQRLMMTFSALCTDEDGPADGARGEHATPSAAAAADHWQDTTTSSAGLTPQLRAVSLLKDVCNTAVGRPPAWVDMRVSFTSMTGDSAQHRGAEDAASESDADEAALAKDASDRGKSPSVSGLKMSPTHTALHPGIAFMDEDDGAALLRSGQATVLDAVVVKGDPSHQQAGSRENVDEDDGKNVPVATVESSGDAMTKPVPAATATAAAVGSAARTAIARYDGPLTIKAVSAPHRLRVLLMRVLIQFFSSADVSGEEAAEAAAGAQTPRMIVSGAGAVNPLLSQCLNENVVGLALDCPHYLDALFVLQALQEQRLLLNHHNHVVQARRHGYAPRRVAPPPGSLESVVDDADADVFHVALVDFTSVESIAADLHNGAHSHHTSPSPSHGAAADESPTSARLVEQAEEQFILSQRLLVMALSRYMPVMRRAASTVLAYHTSIIRESRMSGGTNAQATMIVLTLWRKAMAEEGLLAHLLSLAPAEPAVPPSSPAEASSPSWTSVNSPVQPQTEARQPVFLSMVLECTAQLNEVMRAAEDAVYRREEARRRVWQDESEALARASAGAGKPLESGSASAPDAAESDRASRAVSAPASPSVKFLPPADSTPGAAAAGATASATTVTEQTAGDAEASHVESHTPLPAAAVEVGPSAPVLAQRTASLKGGGGGGVSKTPAAAAAAARPHHPSARRRRKITLAHPAAEYQQDLMAFLALFGQSFAHLVEMAVTRVGMDSPATSASASPPMAAGATGVVVLTVAQYRDAFLALHRSTLTCTALATRQLTESGDDVLHLALKASSHWVQSSCWLGLHQEKNLYLRALVASVACYHPLLAEVTDALCVLQEEIEERVRADHDELVMGPSHAPAALPATTHDSKGVPAGRNSHHNGATNSAASQLKRWGGQFAQNVRRLTRLDAAGVSPSHVGHLHTGGGGGGGGDSPQASPHRTSANLPMSVVALGGGPVAASMLTDGIPNTTAASMAQSAGGGTAANSTTGAPAPLAVAPLGPITAHAVLATLQQRLATRSSQEAVYDAVRLLQRRLVMVKTLFSIGSTLGEALGADGWTTLSEGFALIEWLAHRLDLLTRCVRDSALAEEQRHQLVSDVKHLRDALRMICLNNVSRLSIGTFRAFLEALLDASVVPSASQAYVADKSWDDNTASRSGPRAAEAAGPWRSPPPTGDDINSADGMAAILYPSFMAKAQPTPADRRCMAWEAQNRSSCFRQWRLVAECFGLVFASLTTSTIESNNNNKGSDDDVNRSLLAQYAAVSWDMMLALYRRVTQRGHIVFWIQFLMRSPLQAALSAITSSSQTDHAMASPAQRTSTARAASSGGSGGESGHRSASGHKAEPRGHTTSQFRSGPRPNIATTTSTSTTAANASPDSSEAAAAATQGLLPVELRSLEDVLVGLLEDLLATAAVSAVIGSHPDVLDRRASSSAAPSSDIAPSSRLVDSHVSEPGSPVTPLVPHDTTMTTKDSGKGSGVYAEGTAMRQGEAKLAELLASSVFAHTSFVHLTVRLVPFRRAVTPFTPQSLPESSSALASSSLTRLPLAVNATRYSHAVPLLEGPFVLIEALYASFEAWAVESPLRRHATPPVSPLHFPAMRVPFGVEEDSGVAGCVSRGTGSPAEATRFGHLCGRIHHLPLIILSTRAAAVLMHGTTQLVQGHSGDLRGGVWVPIIRLFQCTASSANKLGGVAETLKSQMDVEEGAGLPEGADRAMRGRGDANSGGEERNVNDDTDADDDEDDDEEKAREMVVAELWPAILSRLAQSAADSVSQAFRTVEAIQHDVITVLTVQGLLQLVRCVAAFMRYRVYQSEDVRLHINLSAVQLLWSLADYLAASELPAVAAEELWCTLLLQLYDGCIDARQEVRQSGQKTFFSLVLAHGALFTGDSWRCVLLSVLAPMMGVLLEGLPDCAVPPPQEAAATAGESAGANMPATAAVAGPRAGSATVESRPDDAAPRERVSQAVAQVLQYGSHTRHPGAAAALYNSHDESDEDNYDGDEAYVSQNSSRAPQKVSPSPQRSSVPLRGSPQPARVHTAQKTLLRVFAEAPKQLDDMRVSVTDGATRVFLSHADNMLLALARSYTMPSVASTSTAPAPTFAAVASVDDAARRGEAGALVEAVVSCFIQFCGEACVVVRGTSGEEAALAAVHALHGLMVESPLPGGLSSGCTALAWSALKRLLLRDAHTQHTAKKQCTVNVVSGVEAALCDDVCLHRSLLLERAQLTGTSSAFARDDGGGGVGVPVSVSSPLLHRGGSAGGSSFRTAPGSDSSWRRRWSSALVSPPGGRGGGGGTGDIAQRGAVVVPGSPMFPVAGFAHRRGSACHVPDMDLPSAEAEAAAAAPSGFSPAPPSVFFHDLVAVLKHCVSCEAVLDAYFFPNKVQVTMIEGLQALWPLLSAAEAQTILEAVLLPQFPTHTAVSRYVLQDVHPSPTASTTTTAAAASAADAQPISLRACLPAGAHPNALLIYLDFLRDSLTTPSARTGLDGGFSGGGSSNNINNNMSTMSSSALDAAGEAGSRLEDENMLALQRLAAPDALRAVGHLLGLQYASPAVLAVHDPGTVVAIPDGFFARAYDTFLFLIWDVALAGSTMTGTDALGAHHGTRAAMRRREAVSALVEVFADLLALSDTVMDHYELGSTSVVPPAIAAAVRTLDQLASVLAEVVDHLVSRCDDVSSATDVLAVLAQASSAHSMALAPLAARSLGILRQYASVTRQGGETAHASAASAQHDRASPGDRDSSLPSSKGAEVSVVVQSASSRERLNEAVRVSMLARNRAVMTQYCAKPRSVHAANMVIDALRAVIDSCAVVKRDMGLPGTDNGAALTTPRRDDVAALDVHSLRAMMPDLLLLVSAVDTVPSARSDAELGREKRVRELLAQTLQDVFTILSAAGSQ